MGFWDNMSDDEYEDQMKYLMGLRKTIVNPLSDLEVCDIIDEWAGLGGGFVDVEAEKFHLGEDEDGYIILGHVTPNENNPKQAHFFLLRNDNYKRTGTFKYRIDFVSIFDEHDNEEEEPYMDMICQTNNLLSATNSMYLYWKSFLNTK
jgi:hypothetical protein